MYNLLVLVSPAAVCARWNGQTVGKRLLKIRTCREDGSPLSMRTALADLTLKVFTNMPPHGVVLGMMNAFGNNQCLHNYLCGTVVVYEGPAGGNSATITSQDGTQKLTLKLT